ncbi:GNAT family N-acetyltransferase [Phreatobacter sp.]|uniref:GNAT family N-acetyltransferase n=1 Tax=Phreatobacter sp. TaxID=1966341 RepID=UPI003F72B40A
MTAPFADPLATGHLSLTPIRESDFADLCRLTGDPEVGGRLKHGVLDEQATRAMLATYLATWERRGFGVFAVRERNAGAFVGIAGLWDHDDDLGIALRYAVMPAFRGRGYAGEAARAVLAFAASRGIGSVIAATREDNQASRHILEGLGFTLSEVRGPADHRVVLYRSGAAE